jgi:hypothetical protein
MKTVESTRNQPNLFRMPLPFMRTVKAYFELQATTKQCRKTDWNFSEYRFSMIYRENADWIKHYTPINVKGLTVLDIGAGEGETAKFYIDRGAKKVVCIEPEKTAFRTLKDNANRHPEITPINKFFSLSDLSISHDFLKVDIEGYEELLLNTKLEQPAVIEIHGLQLRDKFHQKGYRIIDRSANGFLDTCYGLWKC